MFTRTATLLGPSKTESLSGYRLGVVVATSDVISRIENVQSIMSLRAPAYAQHVLLPWLRDDQEWLAARLKEFTALRSMTVDSFRRLPWLKLVPQAGTAYVWPDVSALGLPAAAVAEALLCEAGVLVSPGYQFGPTAGGIFVSAMREMRQIGNSLLIAWSRFSTGWRAAADCRGGFSESRGSEEPLFFVSGRHEFLRGGLVPRHSDYDGLISSQFRMGRSFEATRIWMLRATPG
jgi:hypothetical protein